MSNDAEGLVRRSSRFHIVTNPPPHGRAIVLSLARLWPKRVGKKGISKNEIRGVIQQMSNVRLGGTDEIVRCLSNAGVLISSLQDGADMYYIDPVRAEYVADLLERGVRAGYSDPTADHIERRREALVQELAASRMKERTSKPDLSTEESFQRACDELEQDMRRFGAEMQTFFQKRAQTTLS